MSQDVFQMKMDLIMEKCPGVISIHDNIVISGTSEEDHDANLINYLNVGMHPCPKKIQGFTEMTPPINKQQLASFSGMTTYMGNFIPHLSHHTEPLQAMLKQDSVFHWDQMQTPAFRK